MKRLWDWMQSLDRNVRVFWLGLALLFAGLASSVSIETALTWTGGILITDGMLASYLTAWLMSRRSS